MEAGAIGKSLFHCKPSHSSPCSRQLLQQARAVISPNSISEAAATALSEVASHVNERAQAALSRDPTLSQLGDAALLAAAVMCICRCATACHALELLFVIPKCNPPLKSSGAAPLTAPRLPRPALSTCGGGCSSSASELSLPPLPAISHAQSWAAACWFNPFWGRAVARALCPSHRTSQPTEASGSPEHWCTMWRCSC